LRGKDAQVGHGSLPLVEVVLMSRDVRTRELMALTVRSIERRLGEPLRFRAAANGELAARAVLRDRPDIVIADEIASRMGAFALARSLRDDADPYTGVVVILLDRSADVWLASWSGADAWFVKPADPFEVADRVWEVLEERGLVPEEERV
jgi:DNA-binding response OmpR family regulator